MTKVIFDVKVATGVAEDLVFVGINIRCVEFYSEGNERRSDEETVFKATDRSKREDRGSRWFV